MSEQHYAAPQSDLSETSNEISQLLSPLENTKFWVRLCSIVGFVFTGLMVLSGLVLMTMGNGMSSGMPNGSPFNMGIMGFIYVLMAALYFFPSLFLFKYASAISRAQQSRAVSDISIALQSQRKFWKFVGVLALIMVVMMVIGILAAVVIPLMAR